jgi:hypothetical protein
MKKIIPILLCTLLLATFVFSFAMAELVRIQKDSLQIDKANITNANTLFYASKNIGEINISKTVCDANVCAASIRFTDQNKRRIKVIRILKDNMSDEKVLYLMEKAIVTYLNTYPQEQLNLTPKAYVLTNDTKLSLLPVKK